MRDVTLAYLAGVLDSDGFITAQSSLHGGRHWYFGAVVGIAGTRREPHDLAASPFGGNVRTYVPRGDRVGQRDQYQWQRAGRPAVPVLQAVLPHLRIKVDQAHLALALHEAVEEMRDMRTAEDPYPWFGPDFNPTAHLTGMAQEVRDLNLRGRRAAGRELRRPRLGRVPRPGGGHMSAAYSCGDALSACTCSRTGPVALSPTAMRVRHAEAVERARQSGWAAQAAPARFGLPVVSGVATDARRGESATGPTAAALTSLRASERLERTA